MTKKIRLLGLDLDGTLLNGEKKISPATRAALDAAAEQGVTIVPTTGRAAMGVPQELRELPWIRYLIVSNGGAVFDVKNSEFTYENLIAPERVIEIYKYLTGWEVLIDVGIGDRTYVETEKIDQIEKYIDKPWVAEYIREYISPVENMTEFLQTVPGAQKINVPFLTQEKRKKLIDELKAEKDLYVTASGIDNIEIGDINANKGQTLLQLGKMLGIPTECIMACGDGDNDKEMLKLAGVGVAMGNALPYLKEQADYVTKTNDQDGVAHAIEKFILRH